MNRFDDAWLRQYESRRAVGVAFPDTFGFTLDEPFKLLNVLLRMHWVDRRDYAEYLSGLIAFQTRMLPVGAMPLKRARVTITRFSVKECDEDNLHGGSKVLVDCLLARSDIHPHGLGMIFDDSARFLERIVRSQVVSKRAEQRTTVLIERLPTNEEQL